MKVCTCNNCGEIYEDMNPGNDNINYPEEDLDQLRLLEETNNSGIKDFFWGCPKCLTDAHLQDNKPEDL